MKKNAIHNFDISIQNSADIQSSEQLTQTIIKELAKVSKEINQQQDIEQLWQEQKDQKASNTISSNTTSSDSKKSIWSSHDTSISKAPNGGGAADNIDRENSNSGASAGITPSLLRANESLQNLSSTRQVYGLHGQQKLTIPNRYQNTTNDPSVEVIKAEIKNKLYEAIQAEDNEGVKYWTRLSIAFDKGAVAADFYQKDGQEPFSRMYFGLQKGHLPKTSKAEFGTLSWRLLSDLMISRLSDLIKETEEPRLINYYERRIMEIRDPEVNIEKLFTEHDELFLLLKSFFPDLPNSISIQGKKRVYPNLSPQKIYPNLGVQSIYYIWSKGQLNEITIVNGEGEKHIQLKTGRYPDLKKGQWYDYDRIFNADKRNSTFWDASIYNTMHAQHYLYNSIPQRHAYYKFVDAYLKTRGIVSEWFDAAARVTVGSIGSAMQGEVALGSADKWMPNLWYLSDGTDEFLRGGNQYLFADNMQNVKLLLEGKGKMSGEFIDAKGNKQSFKNLSKQELDFKLVEFEQTLVQDYINTSFKELNISLMQKTLNEEGITGHKELDKIIQEINENFTHWMAPDIMQDIMQKYFTTEGKITFNFAKYEDRVKLGQVMVKELYYLKLSDTFKAQNIDKILADPGRYSAETDKYFTIDQKDAVKEEVKHLKEYELGERIGRLSMNLSKGLLKLPYLFLTGYDTLVAAIEETLRSIAFIIKEIEDSLGNMGTEVSNATLGIIAMLHDNLVQIYETLKKEIEALKGKNTNNKKHDDLLQKLENNMIGIDAVIKRLKKRLEEEYQRPIKVVKKEVVELGDDIAANALVKTAKRIFHRVHKIKDENEKQSIFRRDYDYTVAILLYEFAKGEGQEIRNFYYEEHEFARKFLEGRVIKEIMEETLKLLRQTNYDFENKPNSKDLKINLEFSPSLFYLIESFDKHLDSNLAQFFVGGAFALVRIRNKKIEGYVFNETGRESLLLHIADDVKRKNTKGQKETGLSTIKQRIYFTFDLPELK